MLEEIFLGSWTKFLTKFLEMPVLSYCGRRRRYVSYLRYLQKRRREGIRQCIPARHIVLQDLIDDPAEYRFELILGEPQKSPVIVFHAAVCNQILSS